MTEEKFVSFWNEWSSRWIGHAKCFHVDDISTLFFVKDKCALKDVASEAYSLYILCKDRTKDRYFDRKKKDPILSRYKRAALIAYVVLYSDCMDYVDSDNYSTDPFLLKERLAFHMAIGSIIQSFDQERVSSLIKKYKGKPLFSYDDLEIDRGEHDDSFLQSVYKDMYFSRIYKNYNILTMANVFGLLTEKSSLLSELIEPDKNE